MFLRFCYHVPHSFRCHSFRRNEQRRQYIYITEKEGPQKTPIEIMKKSQCGNLIAI